MYATEYVNRSLFRQRKGLHWLLPKFLFSDEYSTVPLLNLLNGLQCRRLPPDGVILSTLGLVL
jgi:hypothetical protein